MSAYTFSVLSPSHRHVFEDFWLTVDMRGFSILDILIFADFFFLISCSLHFPDNLEYFEPGTCQRYHICNMFKFDVFFLIFVPSPLRCNFLAFWRWKLSFQRFCAAFESNVRFPSNLRHFACDVFQHGVVVSLAGGVGVGAGFVLWVCWYVGMLVCWFVGLLLRLSMPLPLPVSFSLFVCYCCHCHCQSLSSSLSLVLVLVLFRVYLRLVQGLLQRGVRSAYHLFKVGLAVLFGIHRVKTHDCNDVDAYACT